MMVRTHVIHRLDTSLAFHTSLSLHSMAAYYYDIFGTFFHGAPRKHHEGLPHTKKTKICFFFSESLHVCCVLAHSLLLSQS